MSEINFDIPEILSYGALGLCAITLILVWGLLRAEQRRQGDPRSGVLTACYVFMAFSVLVACLAVYLQLRERVPELNWNYQSSGHSFQCLVDGQPVGAPLDCRNYGTCSNRAGNLLICKGAYYREAIHGQ